jgi:hypothetical protein
MNLVASNKNCPPEVPPPQGRDTLVFHDPPEAVDNAPVPGDLTTPYSSIGVLSLQLSGPLIDWTALNRRHVDACAVGATC